MSDIALINKDIMASEFGDILVVDEKDDIVQTAINNILTVYGANEFHTDIGNTTYSKRHKMSERDLVSIANDCMDAIVQDDRVQSVINVTAENLSTPTDVGKCGISFTLLTEDGDVLSSGLSISI